MPWVSGTKTSSRPATRRSASSSNARGKSGAMRGRKERARGRPMLRRGDGGGWGANGGVRTMVSRGGRSDLAGEELAAVRAPTLLIVGGNDHQVIEMNREAFRRLRTMKELQISAPPSQW